MKPKLRVENVYKIFGDHPEQALEGLKEGKSKIEIFEATGQTVGVQDVSFDVGEGEIFVVMGLSGSGKSTLVRTLNGLIAPTYGKILIDDDDVASCSADRLRKVRREKITMVFQHFALFPHKTVADNVAYGLKIKGEGAAERRKKALAALEQVGLAAYADSFPSELSGGMQQRVGLARGLATDPQILLMDEPFGALDPLIRREMQEELLHLQKKLKKTIIFITHDLNEALLLGDKIAIMKDGEFVQVGTAQEIVDNPADEYVAAFVADIDRGRVFDAAHVAERPITVELGEKGAAEKALELMEEHNRNALYVVDKDRIAGLVTYQELAVAAREEGRTDLSEVMVTEVPTVERETPLNELYGAASAGYPIAVADKRGRLAGVIEAQAVFSQLSGDESDDTAVPAEDAEARQSASEGDRP
ncbi:glycine betaine/L-proline ABC transporter ATP-binding protein [Nitratireductor aquimarinus]|uniref:quaternary amine ABC transporter ATP-binding protein n=1 Tax=Nitratireductor aquimarinus TaxID=889300 RepID=UPI001A8E4BEE|nr:glycine betaine/L-proline ABC transporter ATP-binding protein [Nitratireductor aquimarinus]MBN8241606.1 glycine betaine/L-proline ABC transporter ATP-binding protein [Nitratireductor aquimarinus]MBY6129992.1 glycine betaine/L-proline ABC transporter ATP-binding protein [Nitratireductor aquimarinus]MCA1304119.1 glycine betaine/L-proline ABC transporter ATP-binding protein [Nitratireductor aquimarinus]